MACIWWGVQAWLGGQCVYVFLRCLFPSIANIPNKMPAYTETTSAYILCFVIYWLLSLPTIWVPIHKLRWWFLAKAVIAPIIGFALFGWSITRAGGVGPVFGQPSALKGSALTWQMLISISSCFNNMFTLSKFTQPCSRPTLIRQSPTRLISLPAPRLPVPPSGHKSSLYLWVSSSPLFLVSVSPLHPPLSLANRSGMSCTSWTEC
jgi:cytosine/uracil/thiamine/allantoin permease